MESQAVAVQPARRLTPAAAAGVVATLAIAAAALTWAKWTPYWHKLSLIRATRAWPGHDILAKAGPAHGAPSLHAAWSFTSTYANAVWPAIVAGLLVAAAVEALLPRRLLLRALAGRGTGGSLRGAICALPSLMCTCCTAPVAVSLRRRGVPTAPALAYWLGNPVLNPAVLAFLALVAPWQWAATRALVGLLLVVVGSALVARLAPPERIEQDGPAAEPPLRTAPVRFACALARLAATLLPEYLVVVFALGLFRGWLFPLDGSAAHWGALAVVAAAVLGTLVVVPTGGEIPVAQGLAAAGVGLGPVGALLITLPAISLVSMAMVVRAFSPRVVAAAAGSVAVAGLAAGVLLSAIS
jgi:uncharacterized membrane protein YraQ (UPF0718 family)